MNVWGFVMVVFTILPIVLVIRALGQMRIARTVDVRSQPRPSVFPVPALVGIGIQWLQERKKTRLMAMSKQVKFRKIPIQLLIDTLIHIHNSGADYVDIIGVQGETQDVVTLSVEDEYMSTPDAQSPEDTHLINNKLSDEDIDDLMQ